ncbi:MAG: Crp/Fnr family transcriptional regulator [Betaproteobacteria bacterium]|nr:Crp/Fnr family transcriptional regulator [Betaproteobacteria bacterium]
MLPIHTAPVSVASETASRGQILARRNQTSPWVSFLESGRVVLGVMAGDVMEHQLGVLEGPCWLEASSAVLDLPPAVDAVADTDVELRRVPGAEFRRILADLSGPARAVLDDVARAHRQQTELAVSRLAKDAEARCAEWLLQHAEPLAQGGMAVQLLERKRAIAAQLGIAPETLSRVLRHLRERSLISGSGRSLNLLDLTGLRSLAGV